MSREKRTELRMPSFAREPGLRVSALSLVLVACGGGAAKPPSKPPARPAVIRSDGGFEVVDYTAPPTGAVPGEPIDPTACRRTIATAEANTNQSEIGGHFYTYIDRAGSRIWPTSGSEGGVFEMSEGGANGTRYAAHITGDLASADMSYAGMGLNFVDPKGPFDASPYYAVAFWARRGPNGAKHVRFGLPDSNTDPDGHVCRECFNDFGVDLTLDASWTRYVLPFDSLRQDPTWGDPHPAHIEKSGVYGLQLRVRTPGAFDVWIDEIELLACREPPLPPGL